MNVSPLILAIRAVGAEFAQRIFLPVVAIAAGVLLVLHALLVWLVTLSEWWWLLFGPVIFITVLFIFAAVMTGFIIRFLKPTQTKSQREHVRSFVDSLQFASETVQTPKFILLFRLLVDVLSPSKKGIVSELSHNASSLQKGFTAIIGSFS